MEFQTIIIRDKKRAEEAMHCAHHNIGFKWLGGIYWVKNYTSKDEFDSGCVTVNSREVLELTACKVV